MMRPKRTRIEFEVTTSKPAAAEAKAMSIAVEAFGLPPEQIEIHLSSAVAIQSYGDIYGWRTMVSAWGGAAEPEPPRTARPNHHDPKPGAGWARRWFA